MNILITGGTSGLGKASIELLQKDNHKIYFTYLPIEESTSVAKELEWLFPNVKGESLDFCDRKSVNLLCEKISDWDIDVLVNCTYVGKPQTTYFHKIPVEQFLISFQNNIIPTVLITKACLEVMRKKKFGKIINIITEAVIGLPPMGYTLYAANKAYLMELSSVWNKEYIRYNITSNCILPAFMQTGFAPVDKRVIEQMEAEHPLKRILTPKEVAQSIKYFVESSQQVNGVKLQINAGVQLV